MRKKNVRDFNPQGLGRMSKELTTKQKLIMGANSLRTDGCYIESRIEEGQQRIIKCVGCQKDTDLSESVEYGAAVAMFKARDGMCVSCYHKLTGKLVY